MNMHFSIKTTKAVIKERAFGGTYFRDIYSDINGKYYTKSWKELDELENVDKKLLLLWH